MNQFFRRSMIALAAIGALATGYSAPAHAWWRGGVIVGVPPIPFFAPPPVVYPPYYYPPAYYPPPPAAYTPAPGYAQGGRSCYAGGYVCPLNQPILPGGTCSCPTNGGGRVGGTAG
jgi:hypothetical protein